MGGIKDRLSDLSWLGDAYVDQGWVEVGEPAPVEPPAVDKVEAINAEMALRISQSDPMVAADYPSTKGERAAWLDYRKAVRSIPYQSGYPDAINWPTPPSN